MVKLGTIAVDGTKLKAEAELKAQIAALLNKARAADEAEKNEPELDIPAEIARRQGRVDPMLTTTLDAHQARNFSPERR